MVKLFLTVGLPASGKTSYAKGRVFKEDKTHRFSYDDFRAMMFANSARDSKQEAMVQSACLASVTESLMCGFDVIVDNTSLTEKAQQRWKTLTDKLCCGFEIVDFRHVTPEICIQRDNLRQGFARVSPPVIWNMALQAGLMKFDSRPIVIVDVDGTMADCTGIRNPYDESKVHLDNEHPVVLQWVKNLHHWSDYCMECYTGKDVCTCSNPNIAKEFQIIVVSGRSTLCALGTYNWLSSRVPFEALFMRNRGDRRPDVDVKQEILDRLLKIVPKEQIKFVLDDRPSVCRMWKKNGFTVYPVRGAVEEF